MLNVKVDKKFTNELNGSNDTSMNHLPPPGSLVALVGGSYNGLFATVSSYTPAYASSLVLYCSRLAVLSLYCSSMGSCDFHVVF
jgi:hypothetical protein